VVMKSTVFWVIMPCSPLKVNRRFGGTYRLHFQGRISRARYQAAGILLGKFPSAFMLPSCSTYSPLKMVAICSSETSVDFQRTIWRYIPENSLNFQGRISRARYHLGRFSSAFMLVSCSTYSTLKMEAICPSETSVNFQLTTRCYIAIMKLFV
jgi:uncharacterized membrane protein YhaH (DUF805 family)